MTRELYVDGTSVNEDVLVGANGPDDPEVTAPFYVFDADQQRNIAGPFSSYVEAKKALQAEQSKPSE